MNKVEGLHLGKAPAKKDIRTLNLRSVIPVVLPEFPASYDVDSRFAGVPFSMPMYANNLWGDCVIAGRAHQTLRFEAYETRSMLNIKDSEVLGEYWKEQGAISCWQKPDNGLVMLDSLKAWRNRGWRVTNNIYTIYAFGLIDWKDQQEVKATVNWLLGGYAGIGLPKTAQDQYNKGQAWSFVKPDGDGAPRSWGGHCVYIVAYNEVGPVCITWGKRQQMTWEFLATYCDELYGIIDNKDAWVKDSPVDLELLSQYLSYIGIIG